MSGQLTLKERYIIEDRISSGYNKNQIAQHLGISASTVTREIKRNAPDGHYDAERAHAFAWLRMSNANKHCKITPDVELIIINLLWFKYTPEVISLVLGLFYNFKLSTQSIYNYINANRDNGGNLYTWLPLKGRTKKKGKSYKPSKDLLQYKDNIANRPDGAHNRSRFGHFEIDTIVSKDRKGGIVTIVDRKSRRLWAQFVKDLTAKSVNEAILDQLSSDKANPSGCFCRIQQMERH